MTADDQNFTKLTVWQKISIALKFQNRDISVGIRLLSVRAFSRLNKTGTMLSLIKRDLGIK
jgi:hypothetical protein